MSCLPQDFKIYEKVSSKKYRLIFARKEDEVFDPKNELEKLSKTELLEKMEILLQEINDPPRNMAEDIQEKWRDDKHDEITNVAIMAKKKGATNEEVEKSYNRNTIFLKEDRLIDGINDHRQEDLSIRDKTNFYH